MKTSLLFLLITSIPMLDILISFKTNQYPKTMPATKLGRSIFALVATASWITALVFTIIDYF
ncbi:hypothetical protein MGWOODY_Mmi364 [hydrothermal vent metagenome]|uniref:Uncharacterized protein n=1 Tax=hydrothermal vent metagenome TaxID=652676 RepID=A0A160VFI0_9ZZZZ|nr:hypothetical protein [Candidatus Neomarinimicrobiota bacterium]HIB27543.1 hypothetical protein [Candidatus Neomarinimicrobiota bacterium]HIM74515.1 hypothetical protein [Candidatus Neomarinimicrobiota bacterium]